RWSQPQIVFMLGYGMLANGLLDTFFSYNIRMISRRLGRGQLDHTLIQPQPVWLSLLTEGFAPFSGSALLLPGLGLMAWAALRLALPLSPAWIALLFLNVLGSAGVILAFSFVWGSAAFWAPRAAEEISMSSGEILGELKSFPLDALGPVLLGGLLTVLPVGFVAWYPSRALLGLDPHPWSVAVTPLAALVLAAASAALFLKGMQHYGRTGSQRYDSMGHRR
ncbi:MAG TPA: ABC-2 family transporter protein, partial [Armatimonadota bacterium]|nr:ABC-2 family transporter protein [Armatimonadota bacterium]